MADGTQLNAGSGGDVILTDDLGSSKVQVVKAGYGPDGEIVLVTTADPLPSTLQAEAADGGAAPSKVLVLGGYDGSAVQRLVTDASGVLQVDVLETPTKALLESVKALLETIDADTGNIATSTGTLDNAIAGSEMQVDVVGALPAGANAIGKLAANSGVDIGDVDVTSISAGSNKIGDVGISTRTSGGCSMNKNLDVDESEDAVKAEAGQIYGFYFFNAATSLRYLKYYNATVANVTVGTTEPVLTFPLPAGAAGTINFPCPVAFSTAITIAATTGLADNNAGAPSANDVIVNTFYA